MDDYSFEKVKKRKSRNIIDKILVFIIFILLIVFSYSAYKIYLWYQDNSANNKQQEEAMNVAEVVESDGKKAKKVNKAKNRFDPYWDYIDYPFVNVDFDKLSKINPDTVAWVNMRESRINYPVVKTTNNNFYLNHDYYQRYNDAGWVFMDYRNESDFSSKNTIIYAHSRVDGSMFHTLRNSVKKSWYSNPDNRTIRISTPKENSVWLIFSAYTKKAETYYLQTDFASDEKFESWINKVKNRSKFNYKTEVNKEDKILTLSSCYTADGIRVAVHAKLIKVEER